MSGATPSGATPLQLQGLKPFSSTSCNIGKQKYGNDAAGVETVLSWRGLRSYFVRRSVCKVISGGQFKRTGNRLVPAPTEV